MVSTTKHYGIIVGVDGSPESEAAVSWAAHDAALRGLPLTLVHVESPAAATWSQAAILEESPEQQVAEGRSLLESASTIARDAVAETAQIQINGELLSSTTPVPNLVEQSREAELIVVGSRGRGALSRSILGSVSAGLISHAHCPVALIRDVDPLQPDAAQGPVLVGIDGSTSDLATAIAFEEASLRHTELIALHAWNDVEMNAIPGYDWSPTTTAEGHVLAEALAGWQQRYPDVSVQNRVVSDRAAHALVDASESAQLVVVGTHGSGALAGMLLGSVSNAVVQAVRRPVIVARRS
ncbi:universal stress protein [Mycobacterium cookii]|uniref:Universal stress protein n=1 Tax=Mycobacterium cookii TaxID=1775 RepID=A0A7I7KW22_9MYCO|nr:universal stress protein [Mycobacterium cookii]MCV7329970.1 universal stress protein [Mycobacterium cookii]BBX45899.1 universal stress protein [Mycobacterium cookii]